MRKLALVLLGTALWFSQQAVADSSLERPDKLFLTAVVHDLKDSHPDAEKDVTGLQTGCVKAQLGGDKKPVMVDGNKCQIKQLKDWYDEKKLDNLALVMLTLEKEKQLEGFYTYSNPNFFPIDGKVYGNEGKSHNYYFGLEAHAQFTYKKGQTLNFVADDDVWVFIDNKLVLDLGGIHASLSKNIDVDKLGLTEGKNYPIDIFFAERHTVQSTFKIQTNILLKSLKPMIDEMGNSLTFTSGELTVVDDHGNTATTGEMQNPVVRDETGKPVAITPPGRPTIIIIIDNKGNPNTGSGNISVSTPPISEVKDEKQAGDIPLIIIIGLTDRDIGAFKPGVIPGLSISQLGSISSGAMKGFIASQLTKLRFEVVIGFNAEQIRNIRPTEIRGFRKGHVKHLNKESVKGLTREHVKHMSRDAVSGLQLEQFNQLDPEAVKGLTADNLGGLNDEILQEKGDEIVTAVEPTEMAKVSEPDLIRIVINLKSGKTKPKDLAKMLRKSIKVDDNGKITIKPGTAVGLPKTQMQNLPTALSMPQLINLKVTLTLGGVNATGEDNVLGNMNQTLLKVKYPNFTFVQENGIVRLKGKDKSSGFAFIPVSVTQKSTDSPETMTQDSTGKYTVVTKEGLQITLAPMPKDPTELLELVPGGKLDVSETGKARLEIPTAGQTAVGMFEPEITTAPEGAKPGVTVETGTDGKKVIIVVYKDGTMQRFIPLAMAPTLATDSTATMDATQVTNLGTETVATLTADHVSNLPAESVTGLTTDQVANLDPEAVTGLSTEQVQKLTPVAVKGFKKVHVIKLTISAIKGLTAIQVAQLTKEAVSGLTATQVESLSPEATAGLNAENLSGLDNSVVEASGAEILNAVSPTEVAKLPETELLRIVLRLNISKMPAANLQKFLPTTWKVNVSNGKIKVKVGMNLPLPRSAVASLPDLFTMPAQPDLSIALTVGGATQDTGLLDTLNQTLVSLQYPDFSFTQENGVVRVKGAGKATGAEFAFVAGEVTQASEDDVTTPGLTVNKRGDYVLKTVDGLQYTMLPAPRNPAQLLAFLPTGGTMKLNSFGELRVSLPAMKYALTAVFEPSASMDTKGRRSTLTVTMQGKRQVLEVVDADGMVQKVYPAVANRKSLVKLVKRVGIAKYQFRADGQFYFVSDGLLMTAIPTFDVTVDTTAKVAEPQVQSLPDGSVKLVTEEGEQQTYQLDVVGKESDFPADDSAAATEVPPSDETTATDTTVTTATAPTTADAATTATDTATAPTTTDAATTITDTATTSTTTSN
jgi:fibro-slime domain-containing protein